MTEEVVDGRASAGQTSQGDSAEPIQAEGVNPTVSNQTSANTKDDVYKQAYLDAYNEIMNETQNRAEARNSSQTYNEEETDYGYDPNTFLDEDVRSESFSKHRDFSSLIRELKKDYISLKKGFDGKVENWPPEVVANLAEKVRGTAFGIPNDPSGYEDLQEESLNGLLEKYQSSFKNKEEKNEFLTALKTGAYLNGVPKDKLGTFAETFLAIKRGAFEEATLKQAEFFAKQEKATEKAWGENAERNKAMIYQYLSAILPKAHPDGAEAGKRAADVLVRSGAIKNKDAANLFLEIMKDYFPQSARAPSPSQSSGTESRFMRVAPGGSNYMSQRID